MNYFIRACAFALCFFFMTGPVARADAAVDPTWKDARDHQPQGLHLKMTLKALFHLPGQTFDKSNEITFTVADSIH